jgi:hypothetical protein
LQIRNMPANPAHAVRGPKHTQKKGKTPALTPAEKGGKPHEMPTHHNLDHYLAADIAGDRKGPLFRTRTPIVEPNLNGTTLRAG